jgi:hypothetical protein
MGIEIPEFDLPNRFLGGELVNKLKLFTDLVCLVAENLTVSMQR